MNARFIKIIMVLAALVLCAGVFAQEGRPEWLRNPVKYGREVYEGKKLSDETKWAYVVGVSLNHSSERRARTRAEQGVQESISATVATELTKNLDQTAFSEFAESMTEDMLVRYEEALNLSVSIKVPSVEYLEYHVEKENVDGKRSYTAYVFARYLVTEIREFVEKVDVEQVVEKAEKVVEKEFKEDIPEELSVLVKSSMAEEKVSYVEELAELEETIIESESVTTSEPVVPPEGTSEEMSDEQIPAEQVSSPAI